MGKSCIKCLAIGCIVLLICGAIIAAALFAYAGRWLAATDAPQPADVLVVLGGAFERTLYAADLYQSGYSKRLYLSHPRRENGHRLLEELGVHIPNEREISALILQRKGVPAADILMFPRPVLSTADEAMLLAQLLEPTEKTLLVVTSAYHARRARLVFEHTLEGRGIRVLVVATPYDRYDTHWWKDQDSARQTVLELAKTVWYLIGGHFSTLRAEPPSFAGNPVAP